MRSHKISSSSLETYLKCPHQYYLRYHGNGDTSILHEDKYLRFGIIVHKALEILRSNGNNKDVVNCLTEAQTEENMVLKPDEFSDAVDLILNFMSTRDIVDVEVVETEMKFEMEIKNFMINGYIDCVEKVDDNHFRVRDYKTGHSYLDMNDLNNSIQLKMYSLAVMHKYDVENVEVAYDQLRFDAPEFKQYTKDELIKFVKYLCSIQQIIKEDDTHEARIDWHCRWCNYFDSCEYANNIVEIEEEHIVSLPLERVVALFHEYNEKSKIAKKIADCLKVRITDEMGNKMTDEFESSNWKATMTRRNMRSVNATDIADKIPLEAYNDVFNVSLGKLKNILDEDIISQYTRTIYSNPYLRVTHKNNNREEAE